LCASRYNYQKSRGRDFSDKNYFAVMSVLNIARQDVVKILKTAGIQIALSDIVFPPDYKLGDFSFPLFGAAKEAGIAPAILAQKIAEKLKPQGLVEKIEIAGPYVNFWLKREEIVREVVTPPVPPLKLRGGKKKVLPLRLRGSERGLRGGRVMMEMISPNNNKPLHLGHLRNAFLGESVARMLEAQGAKLIRTCLFNDRGLHIAKSMLAYKLWGAGKTPESERMKGDEFVVSWYVLFEHKAREEQKIAAATLRSPRGGLKTAATGEVSGHTLQAQAEELVRKWEAGDKETLELWKKMSGWALEGINMTLKRLGMKFDAFYYESKLWKAGKKVVVEGLKRGIFKKEKSGAVLIEFEEALGLPPKVLQRADGTTIYATADLALGPEKFSARGGSAFGGKKYKLAHSIWCVGQEQNLYFKQLFAIYKMLGHKWADQCEHLSYGLVFLPEGKMKTREGTVVEADALLNKMYELVYEEVKARHAHLTEAEIGERAEIIAQAAVRYYLLSVSPKSLVHFDPKASISFTGHTGPYLLYTYARIASILRKAKGSNAPLPAQAGQPHLKLRGGEGGVTNDCEWRLIFSIARFSEIVAQAADQRDPSQLAQYLYSLAKTFSDFYEAVPVLQSEEPTRGFRLALLRSAREILGRGLHLLTIQPLEEM